MRTLVALGLVLLTGCVQAEDAGRRAWLQSLLVQDNQILLERERALTAGKFRKMSSRPYDFLRGALVVYLADAARPDAVPTRFGTAAASRVLVLGDPHPENLGAFRRGDSRIALEFNDFDGATFGPYHLDVRRLAVGFVVAGLQMGLDDDAIWGLAGAVAEGYTLEIERLGRGLAPVRVRGGVGFGRVVDDLLRRAERDGDARAHLADYTRLEDGVRRLKRGEIEASPMPGVVADALEAVDADTARMVRRALARYAETLHAKHRPAPGALRPKDIARRLGAGVASYPRLRYYVLVEGATGALDDDLLLELKEVGDPARFPGYVLPASRPFVDNGERAVRSQRAFQEVADADPWLGWAAVGPLTFRVRHRTRYQRGLSLDRLTEKVGEGEWTAEDVADLARVAGRLLARGHALAPTADGGRGLGAIRGALGAGGDGFVDETVGFARSYAARVLDDHLTFAALLDEEGPWLGHRPLR